MKVYIPFKKSILAGAFLLVLHTIVWGAPEYSVTNVFVSGTEGYHTYRIPAMVRANDGTLLAFCEGRKNSTSDSGDIDIVLKRSSDNGVTWGPMILVQEEGTNASITIGNPAPAVDASTGYVHLLFCRNNDTVYHTVSTNNGLTWATRTEITSTVKLPEWGWYATGPGHGIQLSRGDQAGRLIIPSDHKRENNVYGSQILYSDDHGSNWSLGAYADEPGGDLKPNETLAVELNTPGDGGTGSHIYINSRDHGSASGTRSEARSGDGGITLTNYVSNAHFISPIVQGSVIRFSSTDEGDAMDRIIFSCANGSSRDNGALWTTTNETATWSAPKRLFTGFFAYSDMAMTAAGDLGVLAECNENGTSDYAFINFIRVNEEWLDVPPPLEVPPRSGIIADVNFSHFANGSTISDASRIRDYSGNNHHGFWGDAAGSYTITNTPNGGIGVDSTTTTRGYVFLRDNLSMNEDWWIGTTPSPFFVLNGTNSYTFEAVVNWNHATSAVNGLMGQTGSSQVWIRENGGYLEYVFDDGPNRTQSTGSIDISTAKADGQFHALAVVYDAANAEIRTYLDGIAINTNANALVGAMGNMTSGTADFRMGAYNTKDSSAFNGLQDHYRISSFARTPAELLTIDPLDPAALTIDAGAGAASLGMTNLTAFGLNTLQFTDDLVDGTWIDLDFITGTTETNWPLPVISGQGFYRIKSMD